MIEIKDITKKFGNKIALDHVSLALDEGIYGLLGPNGAGKTTLMRILATVLSADCGEIRIDSGQYDSKETRRKIGYLPQHFSMYKGLTVEESLRHIAILKEIGDSDLSDEVEQVLENVNLAERRKSRVGSLSGGMLRRLGIAQALLGNPSLLIVDEPTAGLDPEERLRFRDLLSEIGSSRVTLISTHIVEDIEAVCDHVGILSQGKVLAQGSREELTGMAEGKVWEITSEKKIVPVNNIWIVSQKKQDGRYLCRVIRDVDTDGENQAEQAQAEWVPVEPTLEDAYIYLNGKAENR